MQIETKLRLRRRSSSCAWPWPLGIAFGGCFDGACFSFRVLGFFLFRIEQSFGARLGGFGFGFCVFRVFTADGDVFTAADALGFGFAARDDDGDRDFDVRMQRQRHLVLADRLDRRIELDGVRLMALPSVEIKVAMSRVDTEPNNWPVSDA